MAVLCNDLSTAYQGFVFDAPHTGTNIWKGNKMQTLARGFVLSNNGQIGQQGSAGNPIDNQWNGSWTGTNYGTYTADNSTYASNSPLYVRQTGAQYYPPNNYGNPQIQSYFGGANVYTTTGSYSCGGGGGGGARMMSPGSEDSDENFGNNNFAKLLNSEMLNETEYIEATANYRFLLQNDSVRNSDSIYMDYCNALTGSSIDKFYEAEQKLLSGDMDNASAILQGINTANYVEDNYLTYFNLYKKSFTLGMNASASIGLAELSAKCPGRDGECIHAARALYNSIFGKAFKYLDNCEGNSAARLVSGNVEKQQKAWEIMILPNPSPGKLTLRTSGNDQKLIIEIKDLAGKIIHLQTCKVKDHFGKLEISVPDGLYLVKITNEKNEIQVKKLVVNN